MLSCPPAVSAFRCSTDHGYEWSDRCFLGDRERHYPLKGDPLHLYVQGSCPLVDNHRMRFIVHTTYIRSNDDGTRPLHDRGSIARFGRHQKLETPSHTSTARFNLGKKTHRFEQTIFLEQRSVTAHLSIQVFTLQHKTNLTCDALSTLVVLTYGIPPFVACSRRSSLSCRRSREGPGAKSSERCDPGRALASPCT